MRTGKLTSRPLFFVQFDKSAALDHLLAQRLIFPIRAITPKYVPRLAKLGHFLDPCQQRWMSCFIRAQNFVFCSHFIFLFGWPSKPRNMNGEALRVKVGRETR